MTPKVGSIYPLLTNAPIKAPAASGNSGAGIKLKNLLAPKTNMARPSKYLAIIATVFIICKYLVINCLCQYTKNKNIRVLRKVEVVIFYKKKRLNLHIDLIDYDRNVNEGNLFRKGLQL